MLRKLEISLPFLCTEPPGQCIRTPADVQKYVAEMENFPIESFAVLGLNVKNHLIAKPYITSGLTDGALISPREVCYWAIAMRAMALIIVHNHPSGNPEPSSTDVTITKQLLRACQLLDISMLDHIVIGRDGYSSMRESGLVDFSGNKS